MSERSEGQLRLVPVFGLFLFFQWLGMCKCQSTHLDAKRTEPQRVLLHQGPLQDAVDNTQQDDMTKPLVDYYIFTSHNTYLEGDQV